MRLVIAADLQALPLTVFAVVLAVTLGITYWASKRTSTATQFWAAGRGVTGLQIIKAGLLMTARAPRPMIMTMSSEKGQERTYDELDVRGETGLGAETGEPVRARPAAGEQRRPVGVASK
jgi:hypothetical protein